MAIFPPTQEMEPPLHSKDQPDPTAQAYIACHSVGPLASPRPFHHSRLPYRTRLIRLHEVPSKVAPSILQNATGASLLLYPRDVRLGHTVPGGHVLLHALGVARGLARRERRGGFRDAALEAVLVQLLDELSGVCDGGSVDVAVRIYGRRYKVLVEEWWIKRTLVGFAA